MATTDELSAADDKTLVFHLKRPFPLLPEALGKVAGNMCAIMPERLTNTDPYRPITEMVSSGPFRQVTAERVPGALSVYTRFEDYVPRPAGTPSSTAGPKVAYLDRIEWGAIPYPSTAMAALQRGQIGWWQEPSLDLYSVSGKNSGLITDTLDPTGLPGMVRFNHLQPPFNSPDDPACLAGCGGSGRLHAGGGGDRPCVVEGRCWLFRCRLATRQQCRSGSTARKARHGPGQGGPCRRRLQRRAHRGDDCDQSASSTSAGRSGGRHAEARRHQRGCAEHRLGLGDPAPGKQSPSRQGRMERMLHQLLRRGSVHAGNPSRPAWQWRGRVVRLVQLSRARAVA
ncbi:MAG: hypothetical protein EON48_02410 [Acetobacteraceae bacterium]|nr:MAG: hypothetical protein EON48_02410 [Acetobacteraceae bacterium]